MGAGALHGLAVDLQDLIGPSRDDLVDALLHAPGWRERFGLAEELPFVQDTTLLEASGSPA